MDLVRSPISPKDQPSSTLHSETQDSISFATISAAARRNEIDTYGARMVELHLLQELQEQKAKRAELESAVDDLKRNDLQKTRMHENALALMQQMQTNHQEAISVLSSRIKSLEESIEISKREHAQLQTQIASLQTKLCQKQTECDEMTAAFEELETALEEAERKRAEASTQMLESSAELSKALEEAKEVIKQQEERVKGTDDQGRRFELEVQALSRHTQRLEGMIESILQVEDLILTNLKATASRSQEAHERKVMQCRFQHREEVLQLQLRHEQRCRELEEQVGEARGQATQALLQVDAARRAQADQEEKMRAGLRQRVCEAEVEFESRAAGLQREADQLRADVARLQTEALMARAMAEAGVQRALEEAAAVHQRRVAKLEADHGVQVLTLQRDMEGLEEQVRRLRRASERSLMAASAGAGLLHNDTPDRPPTSARAGLGRSGGADGLYTPRSWTRSGAANVDLSTAGGDEEEEEEWVAT